MQPFALERRSCAALWLRAEEMRGKESSGRDRKRRQEQELQPRFLSAARRGAGSRRAFESKMLEYGQRARQKNRFTRTNTRNGTSDNERIKSL